MARLQRDFADDRDVRLVSISVDPEHDTPDVLRDYAQRFGAAPERWLFLTGDKAAIYRLAQEGFHLSAVDPGAAQPQAPEATPPQEPSGSQSQLRSPSRAAHSLTLPRPLVTPLRWVFAPRLAWAHAGTEHKMLLHSARFVLVDRQARIRGYYHSDEEAALRRLRRDMRTVLREP
jgi:cytochrome oxidase Cu insertion factor (SCO1/SenC/PrrC family)